MDKVKIKRFSPTWDLYVMKQSSNALLVKNSPLEKFLDKYFMKLENNIIEHPEYSNDQIIEKYKKMWENVGTLRSYYTDSWGHKWACFPHISKLNAYIDSKRHDISRK